MTWTDLNVKMELHATIVKLQNRMCSSAHYCGQMEPCRQHLGKRAQFFSYPSVWVNNADQLCYKLGVVLMDQRKITEHKLVGTQHALDTYVYF